MPTRPRRIAGLQQRALWTRTDGDLRVNDPSQAVWLGSDTWPGVLTHHNPYTATGKIIPAVTRLTALITDPLSAVPWRMVESTVNGAVLPAPRWVADPQLLRQDGRFSGSVLPAVQRQPRSTFWAEWIRSAVWAGTGILAFIEDESGAPMAGSLRCLHPDLVQPVRDTGGSLVWEVGTAEERVRTDRDGYLTLGGFTWRLVALRDPHAPVDVDGRAVSLFERHADVFGLTTSIDSYAAGVYRSGVPSGVLQVQTPGLTQETATALKQSWMAAHGGDRRSVAILNASTSFQPLSFSPVDAALIEAKRSSLADLAMAFSLDPAGALGISLGNSATYANVQQHFARLKTDLLPWIEAVEETLSSLLPQGRGIRLDFSELTRPDPAAHYAALKVAVDAGLLTLDEARNALGLPALPAGVEPPPVSSSNEGDQDAEPSSTA
jgi:HK97 family phage portal protein